MKQWVTVCERGVVRLLAMQYPKRTRSPNAFENTKQQKRNFDNSAVGGSIRKFPFRARYLLFGLLAALALHRRGRDLLQVNGGKHARQLGAGHVLNRLVERAVAEL